jgi:DNA-binding response OmpR family regulator
VDKVVSCRELVLAAHGYETPENEARKVIRPHVTNVRQKLGTTSDVSPYILNVRGVGYVLAPATEEAATAM